MPKEHSIVIVDDVALIRQAIQIQIQQLELGIRVVGEASNGEMARLLIQKTSPDIILTDICMLNTDGLALIRSLRQFCPQPQFIIMTGYPKFSYAQEAVRLDVVDFLLKPVKGEELRQALLKALSRCGPSKEERSGSPAAHTESTLHKSIYNYVKGHMREDITREELSNYFNLHPNYFSTWMKEQTGFSPIEAVHRIKLIEAMRMLIDDNCGIGEIASSIGMEHSYFCKLFRRMFGLSPVEFRREPQKLHIYREWQQEWEKSR